MRAGWLLFAVGSFLLAPGLLGAFEPLGVPDPARIVHPGGAPPTPALIELGKTLFFDKRLSANRKQSCASCHNPRLGFGDGMATGRGARGNPLRRNTPHLYNLAWNSVFLWDGRAKSLEAQATMPITNPAEMGMTIEALAARLGKVPWYARRFRALFPRRPIGRETLGAALAAFVRTIVTRDSPFDRHLRGERRPEGARNPRGERRSIGDSALGPAALRGLALFRVKANCVACHDGPNLTDGRFHNVGVLNGDPGLGRFDPNPVTVGAFKTPGLRNAALTAPYMHDGSLETLDDVVRHYNRGGGNGTPIIRPLNLTEAEIADLVAFLESLTDDVRVKKPKVP